MRTIKESIVSSVGAGKEKIIKNILKKIEKQTNTYYNSTEEHKFDVFGNEIFVGDVILYSGVITHNTKTPLYVESLTPTNDDIDYILCWNPCDNKLYNIFYLDTIKIINIEKYVK
jgi:hypothetical protein